MSAIFGSKLCGAYVERTWNAHHGWQFLRGFSSRLISWGSFLRTPQVSRFCSISRIFGLSESRRQPRGWHTLDGNLATSLRVPPTASSSSSGTPKVPPPCEGNPIFLRYVNHTTSTSTSTGVLRRLPWGTQGKFQVTLRKVFSFLDSDELKDRPKACPHVEAQPTQQMSSRRVKFRDGSARRQSPHCSAVTSQRPSTSAQPRPQCNSTERPA